MSGAITRRGVMAAFAAGAVSAKPSLAAGATAPATADAVLIELGQRYDEALAQERAALDAYTTASDVCAANEPEAPGALRHTIRDHVTHGFPLLPGTEHISAVGMGDPYTEAEIAELRTMTHRNEEGRARAEEIIAASDGHQVACKAVTAAHGYDAAQSAHSAAKEARKAIGDAIVAARATTLHGLVIRARIVAKIIGDDFEEPATTDEKMIAAILRDLQTIAA